MPQTQRESGNGRWAQALASGSGLNLIALTAGLYAATFVMCYALLATPVYDGKQGLMNITESWGALERVALWQRALSWFPGGQPNGTFVTWPNPLIVWTVRVCMVVMFSLHWLAFRAAWSADRISLWKWLVGPVGAQVILLLMVPSNADVFFYAISGDIANSGLNPYTTHLYQQFENPLYPYNHWVEMTTVYGPLWTMINQGIMTVTGHDPTRAVLAYKLFFGVVVMALAVGVWGAARLLNIRPKLAVAAAVFVAWQPNMMIESSGQAHNDPLLIGFVLAAVALAILGSGHATRGGIILVMLSALVKYVSLPMVGILALTRLDRRSCAAGYHRVLAAWLLDAIAIGAVLFAAFRPYWSGWGVLREMLSEPGRLYTNPIWFGQFVLIRQFNISAAEQFRDVTRPMLQSVAIVAIVYVIAWFGWSVWHSRDRSQERHDNLPIWARPMLAAFAAIFAVLALVPVNTHPWYWTWPVVPIAMLIAWDGEHRRTEPRQHRWLAPYLVLTAFLTLAYHTRIVVP